MANKKSPIRTGATPVILNPQPVSGLLDEKQAAQFLGLEPRTLRGYRKWRRLPHIRISGRVVRYRQADLNSWLDSYRTVIS
jgi:predicted DNA-binding transcriptional regulator AlpA